MLVCTFLCRHLFSFLLGIYLGVESLGHVVTMFNHLRNCHTVFQSNCNVLHFHKQCMSDLISPHASFFFINYLFCLFLAALGLCCCTRAFSSCGKRGLLFVAVHVLLIAVASLVAEHGL